MRHLPVLMMLLPLLAASAVPALWAQEDATFRAPLARGDEAYARFDNEAALAAFSEAYAQDSTSLDVLTRLSRTHNDYAQDRLAANDRAGSEHHFNLAVRYAEALERHHPDEPATYFFLAAGLGQLALFKGGKEKVRIGRAVEAYCRQAIEIDPDFPLPYIALGLFYREVSELSWIQRTFANALFGGVPDGTKEDAVRMLRQAIALDDRLTTAHYELGMTYRMMDQHDLARRHLERSVALPPFNTADRRNQAKARQLLTDGEG